MKHQRIEVPDVAQALFGSKPRKLVDVDARRPFRERGEGLDEIVYVCTGLLAIYSTDNVGHRTIVALRFPNEAILPGGRAPRFAVRAIVKSSLAIAIAHKVSDTYLAITQRNEMIAQVWLARQHLDTDARVAHLLCETAIRSGQGIGGVICPFNQAQIGEITGQTSVNVNRVLADLERAGLLERKLRAFTFPDWHELARLGSFRADYLE